MARRVRAAETDYSVSKLPHTRCQLFFDVIKQNWQQLLLCGFIVLLFSLPWHFLSLYKYYSQSELYSLYQSAVGQEKEQIYYQMITSGAIISLCKIPCFMLLSVCIAGLLRVMRQHSWGENVFFGAEFSIGVKQNAKQALLISFVVALIQALAELGLDMSSGNSNATIQILSTMPTIIFALVVVPISAYFVVSLSIYSNSFGKNVKIAFIIFVKKPFQTYLALICCAVPFVLQFIPNFVCNVIGCVVGSFFAPLVMLGWYLFSLKYFDEYVNKQNFPSLVNKGVVSSSNE